MSSNSSCVTTSALVMSISSSIMVFTMPLAIALLILHKLLHVKIPSMISMLHTWFCNVVTVNIIGNSSIKHLVRVLGVNNVQYQRENLRPGSLLLKSVGSVNSQ